MKQDAENLNELYKTGYEADRLSKDRSSGLEKMVTEHYLKTLIPKGATVLDACAGFGVYAFMLAQNGYKVTAGDIVANHVEAIKEKDKSLPILQEIYQGSMCDLSRFNINYFDAVLNLGAYYHNTDKTERDKSISESKRILKQGGLIFVAYINKYAVFIKYCSEWRDREKDHELQLERGYYDGDERAALFYRTTPEDIEDELKGFGFEIVNNVATDGMRYIFKNYLNELPDDLYEKFIKRHFEMCEKRTLLGYSEHGLVIGRKT